MYTRNWQTRWFGVGLLAGLVWAVSATSALAQGGGGGTGGGGGGGLTSSLSGTGGGSSGGSAFSGLGGSTGGKGSSTTNATISKNNPFFTYMGGPLAAGLGQNNTLAPTNSLSGSSSSTSGISNFQLLQALTATQGSVAFGSPLYTQTTTSSTGSSLGALGGTGSTLGRYPGISSFPNRRAPSFVSVMAEDLKPSPYSSLVLPPNQMVQELRSTINRSTRLKAPARIQVYLEDNTVVLQGEVSSDSERRLAEGLMRVTPGVRSVRNELKVNKGN